ncbi:hydroxyproline-rich glycoprotein [Phlyctema vagabunda]|uniref:Hydroxyproline-rich glycoprotein n=1 Tax=Phlyctema vagabunda TaxID=108571 RepID=A0ABR4PMC9_9HELO
MSTTNSKTLPTRGKQIAATRKGNMNQTQPPTTPANARGKQSVPAKRESLRMSMSPSPIEESTITIDGKTLTVAEIRATGDTILDVVFETTLHCDKSIEGARAMEKMKEECVAAKKKPEAVRKLYRVRTETLKKNSKYFQQLLGSDSFGEGIRMKEAFAYFKEKESEITQAPVEELPRVRIHDDEDSTRTFGRERVFEDMLRIVHGGHHGTESKYISLHYLAVLVTMADRFECMESVSRYLGSSSLSRFKYPSNTTEEIIRKKLLIFSLARIHPMQANGSFENCSKELIAKGSVRWGILDESNVSPARWWNLPEGLEDELAFRRKRIISCLASLQNHFLTLYTSKERQCRLGYDSSGACDSFQLGEMIKFLSSKKLLSLSSFSSVSSDDEDYVWPEAYAGSIDELIAMLRRVPEYQIDKNHSHCGLRKRISAPLDYIGTCFNSGSSIPGPRWFKDRESISWLHYSKDDKAAPGPAFTVAGKPVGAYRDWVWSYAAVTKNGVGNLGGPGSSERSARQLFTADVWDWKSDREIAVVGRAFVDGSLTLKMQ